MHALFRAALPTLLLVFSLLFVQQGALAHGISHTLSEQSQDQSLPHDSPCELCAAYAQIGSAIGSRAPLIGTFAQTHPSFHAVVTESPSAPFTAFASRAPPAHPI